MEGRDYVFNVFTHVSTRLAKQDHIDFGCLCVCNHCNHRNRAAFPRRFWYAPSGLAQMFSISVSVMNAAERRHLSSYIGTATSSTAQGGGGNFTIRNL